MNPISFDELDVQFPEGFCQHLSMFGALSQDSLAFLLQKGTLYRAEAGDQLFRLGDSSDHFFVIIDGSVRFYQHRDNDGERVPLRLYKAGEQIGFVGMIGLHQRRGDAMIETGGYLLEISSALFHQLCEQYPEMFMIFLINITREMSREISHLDEMCAAKPI
ncbi:MAG: cyclic nucleotide-binding domain-containing protein [Oceanospirillales bacterium]|nr:cyclic nucleotide-binding domain-containing protein [Oceanospirillales bacterium]MBR9886340.1 cyclic nucleotide-binding domain-containing protein [Oceanospirillales bacterium]